MVLTEPMARRLFGDADPMGQVIRVDERYDCEVTGIVAEPPPQLPPRFLGAPLLRHDVRGEAAP